MRSQVSLKSNTYTEDIYVNVADISVKALRITRGGLRICQELSLSRDDERSSEKSAEAIVGSNDHYRRAELKFKDRTSNCGTEDSRRKSGKDSQIP